MRPVSDDAMEANPCRNEFAIVSMQLVLGTLAFLYSGLRECSYCLDLCRLRFHLSITKDVPQVRAPTHTKLALLGLDGKVGFPQSGEYCLQVL